MGWRGCKVNEIMSKIYKVRPFGLLSANMRTLNPSGKPPSCPKYFPLLTQRRHRQAGMHQRPSHPCDTSHSGHESCLFPVPHLLAYRAGRDRPRQNRRARPVSPRRLCLRRHDVPRSQPLRVCGPSSDSPSRNTRRRSRRSDAAHGVTQRVRRTRGCV
jgi:hypothetical protein